ncbi:DUF4350 domain-containing protein [Olivibacter sp. CPCC 100613]|uniref:DUF4350 domain-containing protein n=1 Tax=Olivibacter sp. CPCC 100613 TaxID=3079931 RepID=UPI002FF79C30
MKDLKLYLFLAFSLLGVYLFIEYNRPAPVNWSPTYQRTDKIPFGTYISYRELPQLFKGGISSSRQSLDETLSKADGSNLLIVAPKISIGKDDYQKLRRHIEQGNDVFLAASDFNQSLLDSLHLQIHMRDLLFAKDSLQFHFVNKQLNPDHYFRFSRGIAPQYFSKIDTLNAIILGTNNKNEANFLRYTIGKGSLYVLASPDFFTNYVLLAADGASYTAKALSYLNPDRPLIYDEYQLLGMPGERSLLRFIFSNPSLKWSYYIMLGCLVLFVLFEIKRRQRIIPPEDPMTNTSVEFVKVVSGVYFGQHDNNDIINKKAQYFFHFIRTYYRLKTSDLNKEFSDLLIERSGVAPDIIHKILGYIETVHLGKPLGDLELIDFNNYMEQFYEQSNILWNKNFSNNALI